MKEIASVIAAQSVHKRFTKRINVVDYVVDDVNYQTRLLALGLYSLELRRLRADITLTYKILLGPIDVDRNKFFNIYNEPPLRGHIYRLRCNTQRLNTGLHFFNSRVIAPWNSQHVDVISFNSLNSFNLSLAKVELSEFVYFSERYVPVAVVESPRLLLS